MLPEKTVIGLMSGTSLDGVDLACVKFNADEDKISYRLLACKTIAYNSEWKKQLKKITQADALTYSFANTALGWHFGSLVKNFITENNLHVDFIASHGHTVFHQPQKGLTTQIGDGAAIAAITNLPVVCDFRTVDVALGGQGAPLVPIGDKYLFNEFDFCVNLGGIANISFDNKKGNRIAFDICPVNMILNELATTKDLEYDKDGELASAGKTDEALLQYLNNLDFYKKLPPKSLGYEWVTENFLPVVNASKISVEDRLNTLCHHMALQISDVINKNMTQSQSKLLVTGGGAFNIFLVSLLKQFCKAEIIIPADETINFKEAIIFALLGYLRWHNKVNTLCSVTGAQKNSIGGAIYWGGTV